MSAEVVLYRTPYCSYCVRAERLLRQKRVAFKEIDVSGDIERRRWLAEVTGRHTVPQIFINGRPIGGCDELYALERAGRLDPLLAENAQSSWFE
jgi:glutaredoxin 3